MEYTFYNEQAETEHRWDVDYKYTDFMPGYISGAPESCYPDEGGTIEDLQVIDENGKDITDEIDAVTLFDILDKCRQDVELFEPAFD